MIANHVHDALSQVKQLRDLVLIKRMFFGYSGRARMVGGAAALGGALVMSMATYPSSDTAHLVGWGVVMLIALCANYAALGLWMFSGHELSHALPELIPAIEAFPALAIGAVTSVALVLHGDYALLFGIWMSLYGLVHVVYRLSLPRANYGIGIFYMVAGSVCLLSPSIEFTNPWPMGLVFFIGESLGGFILWRHRLEHELNESEQPHDG